MSRGEDYPQFLKFRTVPDKIITSANERIFSKNIHSQNRQEYSASFPYLF